MLRLLVGTYLITYVPSYQWGKCPVHTLFFADGIGKGIRIRERTIHIPHKLVVQSQRGKLDIEPAATGC